jgi:hypothetical protein
MSTAACRRCGKICDVADLDSKPSLTLRLRVVRLLRGQVSMLQFAADRGHAFDWLECAPCYGPGFETL